MIALHKDPDGDDIFARSGPGVTSVGDLLDTKTVALEQKVKELELQLAIYKVKKPSSMNIAQRNNMTTAQT